MSEIYTWEKITPKEATDALTNLKLKIVGGITELNAEPYPYIEIIYGWPHSLNRSDPDYGWIKIITYPNIEGVEERIPTEYYAKQFPTDQT